MNRYTICYIQYGNIPIRDALPPPLPMPGPPQTGSGRGVHGVGWGVRESITDIFAYWIQDIGYLFIHI